MFGWFQDVWGDNTQDSGQSGDDISRPLFPEHGDLLRNEWERDSQVKDPNRDPEPRGWDQYSAAALRAALLVFVSSAPSWAVGGASAAIPFIGTVGNLSNGVAGPLAYSASLITIVGTSISWIRHHHDMGALTHGALGAAMVVGVALGAVGFLSMVPGVTGAVLLP